jgi:DNA-binding HxlR family transcriptional regulator
MHKYANRASYVEHALGIGLMRILPKGAFEILTALEKRPKRFNELTLTRVGSRPINRRTLAGRLKMLMGDGLVERVLKSTWPPTAEYVLTEKGQRLLAFMRE